MKNLNKIIIEKLKLNNQSKLKHKINDYNFNKSKSIYINGKDVNVEFLTEMPNEEDCDNFIMLEGNDKNFISTFEPIYILTNWFIINGFNNEDDLLYAAYRIGKLFDDKFNTIELSWYNKNKKIFSTFAIASRYEKDRVWHPEWIKSAKYQFK